MGSMGTFHSTMSCDRLSYSFQNCFGYPETGATYENNDTTKPNQAFCNGSIGAGGKHELVENAPTRRRSRKSSKSRDSCCTGSTATDVDGSAYDLYSPPNHVQGRIDCRRCDSINSHHSINTVSTMNSIPTKRSDLGSSNHSNGAGGFHKTSESSVDPPSFGKKNTNNNVNKNHQSAKPVTRNTVECLTTNNNSQAKTQTLDEYQQKPDISTVIDSKVIPDQSDISSEVESMEYFRKLILKETKRLNEFIEKWDKLSSNNLTQCPLDIRDEIRTVIGKTRLVISERFTQFAKLVDRADGKSGSSNDNRPVLLSDLRGFWDMIYFQVEDVVAKFNALQRISENGWKVSEAEPTLKITPPATAKKTATKRAPRKKPAHGNPRSQPSAEEEKRRREAARKRLAEARKAAQAKLVQDNSDSVFVATSGAPERQRLSGENLPQNSDPRTNTPSSPPEGSDPPNPTPSSSEKSLESVDGDFPRANSPRIESSSCSVSHVAISVDSASISSVPSSASLVH